MLKKNFKNSKQKTLKITLEIGDCVGEVIIFVVRTQSECSIGIRCSFLIKEI